MEIIRQCKINNFFFLLTKTSMQNMYSSVLIVFRWLLLSTTKSSVVMEVQLDSSQIRCRFSCSFFKGLSPDLCNLEQIREMQRPTDVPDTGE